jgi:acetyl-CoA acyltransferase 1
VAVRTKVVDAKGVSTEVIAS